MAGNSAELIFKIKADGSNAASELRKVEAQIKKISGSGGVTDLQRGFKEASGQASNFVSIITGNKLSGATSQITSFAGAVGGIPGPTGLAIGAVVGLTAVGVTLASSLFALTKSSAEYGSEIHDLRDKLGLTAATVTTLKVAADNAGSSIETVSGGTAKFAKLIGQAADGNKTAQKTLADLGVTSYELDKALSQVSQTIFNAKDGTEQITTAQKAFGKSGAELIPVIKQFGGDLEAATKEAERLGITLSDKAVDASDAFGDSLGVLSSQAKAAGVAFSSELMPMFTAFATSASEFYARNKGEVQAWGIATRETIQGVIYIIGGLTSAQQIAFQTMDSLLGSSGASWAAWGVNVRLAVAVATAGLSEMIINLRRIGQLTSPVGAQIGGSVGAQVGASIPRITGGGGGGGKGGGGGQDKAFQDAKRNADALIRIYNDSAVNRVKANDLALKAMQIDEEAHARERAAIEQGKLDYVKQVYSDLLKLSNIDARHQEEVQDRIDEVVTKSYGVQIDLEQDLLEVKLKDNQIDYENYKKTLKAIEDREREHQEVLKQQREKANARAKPGLSDNQKDRIKTRNDQNLSILGDSILSVRNEAGNLTDMIKPQLPIFQMLGGAVNDLASGFGNLVQQIVLTGSAGPDAMKKLVASVLAGVAAQAATLAIMETAYGIAALTPWGAAIYGPAAAHFKAAALFALVAVGSGLAGRAVASGIKDTAGGGSSSGSGSKEKDLTPISKKNDNTFTSGLQKEIRELGGHVQRLSEKIEMGSPGDVVMRGVKQRPGLIGNQLVNDMKRNSGIGTAIAKVSRG